MTADPLRSAIAISSTDDTSLVLPSDKKQFTGQQRVLEQVHTIKRSKSKMVKNDSVSSPISPASVTEHSEPKFQFSPTTLNGTLFRRTSSKTSTSLNRTQRRNLSVHGRSIHSTRQWESQFNEANWNTQSRSNGIYRSGSDPALNTASTLHTMRAKQRSATVRGNRASVYSVGNDSNQLISAGHRRVQSVKATSSNQSQGTKGLSVIKSKSEISGADGATRAPFNITLEEAVKYLTHSDVNYQLCGASFIQHHTFTEEKAKHEVWRLGGTSALIDLLKSDNPQLQQTAASALRNVVFKDNENKLEVKQYGGLEVILTLLRNTDEKETQKQLTGLLWNLSSADDLKPDLIESALPLLTENIVIPSTSWSHDSTVNYIDPEVFYNTTGCLRNLSCAEEHERKSMRNCKGLIDSLMVYIQSQVDRGEPDDKSVENCVCILHNLSYQLEKEAPGHISKFSIPSESVQQNTPKKSLFSPKSSKIQQEFKVPSLENSEPKGVDWLYNTKSLLLYHTLLNTSQKEATLEACCGALQNLTASRDPISSVMSSTIVNDLNILPAISPLLKSTNHGLQKTAMSLVGNMSRVSVLQQTIAKAALPVVASILSDVTPKMVRSDNTMATACRVMHTLMLAEPEAAKKVLNKKLIESLRVLSSDVLFKTANGPAGVLLYSLWGQKDIQSVLKKQGMNKEMFINGFTLDAAKALAHMKQQT